MPSKDVGIEIDKLFENIEKMIDIQDVISYEEQHENRATAYDIKVKYYTPAKEEAKQAFEAAVKEIVKEMFRNRISHKL